MKYSYTAPAAEIICLVPGSPIATSPSWKWSGDKDNDRWGTNQWGAPKSLFGEASAIGTFDFYDTTTNGQTSNSELD